MIKHLAVAALILAAAGTMGADPDIKPFTIKIPDAALKDLHERLTRVRFPDQLDGVGWKYGTDLAYLKEIVSYWRDKYDWRA